MKGWIDKRWATLLKPKRMLQESEHVDNLVYVYVYVHACIHTNYICVCLNRLYVCKHI